MDKKGPGSLPKIKNNEKNPIGLVVPHAGYIYSGYVAAYAYHFLANHGFNKTFIIIGPNHTGVGSGVSVMTKGAWETPFGTLSINEEIAEKLCTGIIDKDETAHNYEHSIEVQLPFLQFSSSKQKFDFVPICMSMQDNQLHNL